MRYIDKELRFPYAESRVFDRRNYEEKEYENWYSVPIYGAAVERKVKGMTGAWNEGNEEAIGYMRQERTVIKAGMLGMAVADALGVPYESQTFEQMQENPCTDMVGYGHHKQPEGSWSDDTSMALCVADSLCRGFDLDDIMKKFALWIERYYYTAAGVVFDIGRTCRKAINNYRNGIEAEYCGDRTINGNGNGGLMRTFPIAVYQYYKNPSEDENLEQYLIPVHSISSLTHAHEIGLICCGLFTLTLREWLDSKGTGESLLEIAERAFEKGKSVYAAMGGSFAEQINKKGLFLSPVQIAGKDASELSSWGYALNTWQIAVWSLVTTDNYRDCVLKAVNVGGDTDTNGAVAGALAGVIYGVEAIPEEWLCKLKNKELIEQICDKLADTLFGKIQTVQKITRFEGTYSYLSMKSKTRIILNGITYENVTSAWLAQAVSEEEQYGFSVLNHKQARKRYRELPHVKYWEEEKYEALYHTVKAKYEQNPDLKEKLVSTGDIPIIFDTTGGHDNELGCCMCKACREKELEGKNIYGKILMRVRREADLK